MLKLTFRMGGDLIEVVIRGNELLFFDVSSGVMTSIEGIKLSKMGCIKEFPDLENDDDWKLKTINRFKEKIKSLNTEMEKVNYVKGELEKQGYQPMLLQRGGFRPQKFK
jgi:hypothetical protein